MTDMQQIMRTISAHVRLRYRRALTLLRTISVTAIFMTVTLSLLGVAGLSELLRPAGADGTTLSGSSNQTEVVPFETEQGGSAMDTPDMNQPSQDAGAAQESTTTITINGETVTVSGNESYDRSYTTSDGTGETHVDISVQNRSDSSGVSESSRTQVRTQTRSSSGGTDS